MRSVLFCPFYGVTPNRGAETCTVPNNDKRRRDRLSLMGRGAPHRWHRRRRQQ